MSEHYLFVSHMWLFCLTNDVVQNVHATDSSTRASTKHAREAVQEKQETRKDRTIPCTLKTIRYVKLVRLSHESRKTHDVARELYCRPIYLIHTSRCWRDKE